MTTRVDQLAKQALVHQKPLSSATIDDIKKVLSEATGFRQEQFNDLTEAEILRLIPVYIELVEATKTSEDVIFSDKINFAKFSRRVFTQLPASIILYLEGGGSLHLGETLHKRETDLRAGTQEAESRVGQGTYKRAVRAKGRVVKGKFHGIYPEEEIASVLTPYQNFVDTLPPEDRGHLLLSQLVTYTSASTGTKKQILLSRYMNQKDLATHGFHFLEKQRVPIFLQIAKGVKAMHDCGYAHMDLHDRNLLLHKEEDRYEARLSDFDTIVWANDPDEEATYQKYLEIDRDALHEHAHLAPELREQKAVFLHDLPKCDIYSFGYLLQQFEKEGQVPPPHNNNFLSS